MAALWAVCIAIVIAPSYAPFGSIAPYDQERLLQVGACAGALLLSAFFTTATRDVASVVSGMRTSLHLALVGTFALGVLSAVSSPHPRAALVEVSQLALVVLATFAVAGSVRTDRHRAVDLLATAVFASAAVAVVELGIRIAAMEIATSAPMRPSELFEHFQNPRFFAQWMTWVLPLMALAQTRARRGRAKLQEAGVWVAWALCWAFAFLAAGRGTFAAQAAATLVVLAVFGRNAVPWARSYGTAALAGVVIYFASALLLPHTWAELSQVVARLGSITDSGRFALWHAALRMISSAPVLGAGPRAMAYDLSLPVAHPHDSVLQWASEWGVPATSLVVGALVAGSIGWLRRRRAELVHASADALAVVSLAAAFIGAAFHSLVCGVLVMPISQLMLVLAAGCALGLDSAPRSRAVDPRWWTPTVAAVLLLWTVTSRPEVDRVLSWTIPPDIQDLRLRPRMWHDETSALAVRGAVHPAYAPLHQP